MLATLALVIGPHAVRLPVWLSAFAALLIAWRYLGGTGRLPRPSRWLLLALALLAAQGIFLHYGTLLGRDAGVALLVTMLSLKLLEMRTWRESTLAVFLGYFVVLTHFLYTQSLFFAAYLFLVIWLLTGVLIALQRGGETLAWREPLRLSAVLLLKALPIMLLLFLLFPRVAGPLWGLPKDAFAGKTGLSDTMEPGSISRLTQSDEVAFRVEFDGALPPAAQRYFRVLVLDRFDGRVWSAVPQRPLAEPLLSEDTAVRYTVTLEPHGKPWLPTLDFPEAATLPADSRLNQDFSVTSRAPVNQRKRYTLTSHPRLALPPAPEAAELERARALPAFGNPRARELARALRAASRDEADYVTRVLALFREQPFFYTLQPPRLGDDSVDEFLFDTRRGFCEHYAASFVFLLRAAGIPARVVTGYQGGSFNPLGNYLMVRQADAHAWAEAWLGQGGWTRVDPTAAVAANRIEEGLASALPAGEPLPLFLRETAPWMRQLRLGWDALNNRWNQYVLGFDQERQIALFAGLGFGILSWERLALYLLVGVGAVVGLLAALSLRPRHAATDAAQAAYLALCAKLARAGLARAAHEGPLDFARRVAVARPDLGAPVRAMIELYVAARYGTGDEAALEELVQGVRRFKPAAGARCAGSIS